MTQAMFYHLTRSPLEAALPMLLARSLESGWHVVVRGTDAGRLDWLDQRLWTAATGALGDSGAACPGKGETDTTTVSRTNRTNPLRARLESLTLPMGTSYGACPA